MDSTTTPTSRQGDIWEQPKRVGSVLMAAFMLVALAGVSPIVTAAPSDPASRDALADAGAASASPPVPEQCEDSSTVVHDSFRTDNETVSQLENGSTSRSTKEMTAAIVNRSGTFWRISVGNTNAYCTRIVVKVSSDAMPPADLGKIDDVDGNLTGEWVAVRDLNNSETYTKFMVVVPPGERTTFAPSKYRVKSLAWASQKAEDSKGFYQSVKEDVIGLKPTLEKDTYTVRSNGSRRVRVPLQDPNSARRIKDYQARYSVDGETWRPVGTDSTAPVYKQPVEDGDAVRLVYNNRSATVKFTANPDMLDKARYQYETYSSGFGVIGDYVTDLFALRGWRP